jgi:hypothetical protein
MCSAVLPYLLRLLQRGNRSKSVLQPLTQVKVLFRQPLNLEGHTIPYHTIPYHTIPCHMEGEGDARETQEAFKHSSTHPTPCTRHPAPDTLHPTPCTHNRGHSHPSDPSQTMDSNFENTGGIEKHGSVENVGKGPTLREKGEWGDIAPWSHVDSLHPLSPSQSPSLPSEPPAVE